MSGHLDFVSHSSFYVNCCLLAELSTLLLRHFQFSWVGKGSCPWAGFQKTLKALMQHKHHTYKAGIHPKEGDGDGKESWRSPGQL